MSVLITDSSLGCTMVVDGQVNRSIPCPADCPYMPATGQGRLFICCRKNRDCYCLCQHSHTLQLRMPSPPALAALSPSPCGRFLYQLSTEADVVHTLHLGTGEICFAAPVGVFPRCMRLHPSGRGLLVAGGAVGEAYLLTAPELRKERVFSTPGPCFTADFWNGGLMLVCAGDGEDIQTVVYTLAPGKLRPKEILRLPGQPGELCVCPDGATALMSTPDGLMKLNIATGELLWNLPQWALCMKLCCQGGMALVSDALNGQVCLLRHEQPWISRVIYSGTDAQACFC